MRYPVSFSVSFKKHKYPGLLIAIEGMDGSGKTTQAEHLVKELKKKKIKALYTKEPTDEPTGKFIRQILSGEIKVPPLTLQYMFCADRAVHQIELERYLKKGYVIVTDRYFWSAVAYGISDMDGKPDYYMASFSILSMYNQFLSPDYTFYLDVSVDEAHRRLSKSHKHVEIYDRREKLVKIQKGYEMLLKKYPTEFTRVEADKTIEKLTEDLVKRVSKKIK